MIDILYLTWNRREFTEASLKALAANTDWSLVASMTIYDDCSTDGTAEAYGWLRGWNMPKGPHVHFAQAPEHRGSPVALMNEWLQLSPACAPLICKIDNDVIVPPGWLNESLAVMKANPEVDLLGIEPGVGPRPDVTRARGFSATACERGFERGTVRADFIGGVGLWRRSIFTARELPIAEGRFGWGHWQEKHADLVKAWIAPGLPLFLLNRLPIEPWASLSARYVAEGWQRPWPEPYPMSESYMWEWWKP